MAKDIFIKLMLFVCMALTGCANHSLFVPNDPIDDHWPSRVATHPEQWNSAGNTWFLTGEPVSVDDYAKIAPQSTTLTALMHPQVFTDIKIQGNFQVQLVGGQEANSVFVVGPKDAARRVLFEVVDNTLCVHEAPVLKNEPPIPTDHVVVRIGVRELHRLSVAGRARVYGRSINSHALRLWAHGHALVLLKGDIHLVHLIQTGMGTISLWGVHSTAARVEVRGPGCVHISGDVGLNFLSHMGNGVVHIVGAHSTCLSLYTAGAGITTIAGTVNLKVLTATQASRVYITCVRSGHLVVNEKDYARVGLAGVVDVLYLNASGGSLFLGQYLKEQGAYITTHDHAHATIASDQKAFAAIWDDSTLYFFGSPTRLSSGTLEGGTIVTLPNRYSSITLCPVAHHVFPQMTFNTKMTDQIDKKSEEIFNRSIR